MPASRVYPPRLCMREKPKTPKPSLRNLHWILITLDTHPNSLTLPTVPLPYEANLPKSSLSRDSYQDHISAAQSKTLHAQCKFSYPQLPLNSQCKKPPANPRPLLTSHLSHLLQPLGPLSLPWPPPPPTSPHPLSPIPAPGIPISHQNPRGGFCYDRGINCSFRRPPHIKSVVLASRALEKEGLFEGLLGFRGGVGVWEWREWDGV